ncbi:MAG: aspartate 1-decarboxylase [Peptococcaceae bacterium]|nr:aspartate 1-decarboxylase [Peptococcaceae bacterium]
MLIRMLKGKIHRATVTDANLHYEGSITVDEELLRAAGILPYEKVEVVNLNNGARFETYTMAGASGSGEVTLNGAAARLAVPGDKVIIMAYVLMDEQEARTYNPRIVLLGDRNRINRCSC